MTKLSPTRLQMVDAGQRLCSLLGLPRSTGQIYGLLYLAVKPLSLDDMVELLGISKASASNGTRQLAAWGAIRQRWIPGDRRDYFEIQSDLFHLLRSSFRDFLKPRLASAQRRLDSINAALDDEWEKGQISKEDYKICCERLKTMARVQKKLDTLAPLAEKWL